MGMREREEMAESGSRRGRFSRSGDQIRGREKTDWMAAEEEAKRKGKGKQAEKKAGGPGPLFWRAFNFMAFGAKFSPSYYGLLLHSFPILTILGYFPFFFSFFWVFYFLCFLVFFLENIFSPSYC
jgi:hypothetical protein